MANGRVGDLIPPGSTLVFEVELAGVSGGEPRCAVASAGLQQAKLDPAVQPPGIAVGIGNQRGGRNRRPWALSLWPGTPRDTM